MNLLISFIAVVAVLVYCWGAYAVSAYTWGKTQDKTMTTVVSVFWPLFFSIGCVVIAARKAKSAWLELVEKGKA